MLAYRGHEEKPHRRATKTEIEVKRGKRYDASIHYSATEQP